MRREVLPARLSCNVFMAAAFCMITAGCALFVKAAADTNEYGEPPVSYSPTHDPIPLLWPEYFESGLDGHIWFSPAVFCLGHATMVFQWPGWTCEALQ